MYYRSKNNNSEIEHNLWAATPVELSYLRGKGNHLLELGLGVTPLLQNGRETNDAQAKFWEVLPVVRIGYRYQRREGGIFYKAGFTPMAELASKRYINYRKKTIFIPWIGLAIGYTLKY